MMVSSRIAVDLNGRSSDRHEKWCEAGVMRVDRRAHVELLARQHRH